MCPPSLDLFFSLDTDRERHTWDDEEKNISILEDNELRIFIQISLGVVRWTFFQNFTWEQISGRLLDCTILKYYNLGKRFYGQWVAGVKVYKTRKNVGQVEMRARSSLRSLRFKKTFKTMLLFLTLRCLERISVWFWRKIIYNSPSRF